MQNYESWMKYIFEKQCHSEIYIQRKLAGCKIMCRNIISTQKSKSMPQKSDTIKKKTCFYKNSYLKQFHSQMNDMIRSHLEKIINENNDNSFLILNKTFGNILIKKQQVPKGSDLNGFIIKNVLKVFKRKMKQMDREKKANDIVSTNIDESLFGDDIDDVNQTEAAQYFKMAADHRHVESMFNYANLIGTCSNSEIN